MRLTSVVLCFAFATSAFAQLALNPQAKIDTAHTAQSTGTASVDTVYDTVYVAADDGIPWNRENFDPNRLLRKETIDPALSVAYTYSVSFMSGPLGSISQTSYLAHLAYEFTPELHLYADLGLWMPLYASLHTPWGLEREDIRQGRVQFILPDVELEYKPTENTSLRVMFVNESDMWKAYGPWRDPYYPYETRRNSTFYR